MFIFFEDIGGHSDDRWGMVLPFFDNFFGGFCSVHFGHIEVHKDEVVGLFFEFLDGFVSVVGDIDGVAELLEEVLDDFLVDGVIFYDEDMEGVFFCEGRGGECCGGFVGVGGLEELEQGCFEFGDEDRFG